MVVPGTHLEVVEFWLNGLLVGLLFFEFTIYVELGVFTGLRVDDGNVIPSELFEFHGEPMVLWTVALDGELHLVVSELPVGVTLLPSFIVSDDSPVLEIFWEDPSFVGEFIDS